MFWARCKASWTIRLAVVFACLGVVLDALDVAALFLNTPELRDAITAYAGPYASHLLKAIGVAVAAARVRSMLTKGV